MAEAVFIFCYKLPRTFVADMRKRSVASASSRSEFRLLLWRIWPDGGLYLPLNVFSEPLELA